MGWRWPWRRATSAPAADAPEVTNAAALDPFTAMLLGVAEHRPGLVTEQTAMTLSAVWRSVSLISGALGTLPLRTLRTTSDDTRERVGSWLDNPGADYQTPLEWCELAVVHLLLHGNAYGQHVYNGAGALAGLNLIHPLAVDVERDAASLGGRRFTVRDAGRTTLAELDASRLTHIPALSLDGLKGLSPIAAARLGLSTALAGDRAAHKKFANGAMIAGLVTPDDEDLDKTEAEEIKATVNRAMTGPENAGDIAVINRKLKFQPWMLSAADAQFLQSRTFAVEEIGRWYGLPPHLLGQSEKSTSWGTGLTEQNRGLARYTLKTYTTRIEQRLSRLLRGSLKCEFDYSAFVAPSPEDEIRLLIQQVDAGLLTPNEARRIRNLPPIDGGDQLRVRPGAAPPGGPPAALAPIKEAA